MNDNLFKIPMELEHFETWIAAPLRNNARKGCFSFLAAGIKGNNTLTLEAFFSEPDDPEEGAALVFTSRPTQNAAGSSSTAKTSERCLCKAYPMEEALEEIYAVYENLFINSVPPSGPGWEKKDDDFIFIMREAIHFAQFVRNLALDSEHGSKRSLDALKALHAKDSSSLNQIVASSLNTGNCYVQKNKEKASETVPLLARYFAEAKDLSFATIAIKALASHRVRPLGNSQDGKYVFQPLLRHYGDPEFLAVWKALLDTERPFIQTSLESRIAAYAVDEACWETYGDETLRSQGGSPEQLFLTGRMTDRLTRGVPFDGVGDLTPIIGKRLSRALISPSTGHKSPKLKKKLDDSGEIELHGCVILDFEGIFMVIEGGHPGCTDAGALSAFPGARDASEQFAEVIGKRMVCSKFDIRRSYHNTFSPNQTLVFEDGTFLISSGWLSENTLRCFKRNWGEFIVKPSGILEQKMPDDFLLEDIYGKDLWFIDSVENLIEAADRNPVLNAYLDGALSQWWADCRQQPFLAPTWRETVSDPMDKKAVKVIWDVVYRWLQKTAPHEGPERAILPNGFSTDRGIAAHGLEDMPEVFAKELGLVWSDPEERSSNTNYEEGIRLTKSIDEANAVAKEHCWRISFQPDSTSLREALVSDMSDPDFTLSQH